MSDYDIDLYAMDPTHMKYADYCKLFDTYFGTDSKEWLECLDVLASECRKIQRDATTDVSIFSLWMEYHTKKRMTIQEFLIWHGNGYFRLYSLWRYFPELEFEIDGMFDFIKFVYKHVGRDSKSMKIASRSILLCDSDIEYLLDHDICDPNNIVAIPKDANVSIKLLKLQSKEILSECNYYGTTDPKVFREYIKRTSPGPSWIESHCISEENLLIALEHGIPMPSSKAHVWSCCATLSDFERVGYKVGCVIDTVDSKIKVTGLPRVVANVVREYTGCILGREPKKHEPHKGSMAIYMASNMEYGDF